MVVDSCSRVFVCNAHRICFSSALQVSVPSLGACGSFLRQEVSSGYYW
jgi:hypothetical protein